MITHTYVTVIHQRYEAFGTGEWVEATTPDRWTRLLERLESIPDASIVPTDTGINVTTETMRGRNGAVTINNLAYQHGAISHIACCCP